jgi:hypothetical protein
MKGTLRTYLAAVAIAVAAAAGGVASSGAAASASPPITHQEVEPLTALDCIAYLDTKGYTIGKTIVRACNAPDGTVTGWIACLTLLESVKVNASDRSIACGLAAQD